MLAKMKKLHQRFQSWCPISWADTGRMILIMLVTAGICVVLRSVDSGGAWVSMVFILGVLFTARSTNGYLYGLLASVIGVFGSNYAFTYPYMKLDFTQPGYMVTFLCMTAASIMTSIMTTRIKMSERIRAEAETEKMRSNLLRAVSHDLRTPLTSIVGASAVLLEDEGKLRNEQIKELAAGINSDAKWLIRVMENLLSITRIGNSQSARINKEEQAAEEVLAEAVQKFKKIFPQMKVSVKVPEDLLMVPMDAVLIEQVLLNLMENVVDHAGKADRIEISAEQKKEMAVFRVRDNGTGIPQDVLPHLFHAGYCPPQSATADGRRNMGIGLSVCMAVVKAHDGEMCAHNLESGGAEFEFRLPMEEKENSDGTER